MTPQWFRDKFSSRRGDGPDPSLVGLPLIHAISGFTQDGDVTSMALHRICPRDAEIVHQFDIDPLYDYRARRPQIGFQNDHYHDYDEPVLAIHRCHDATGRPYLVLSGPEPDYGWAGLVDEIADFVRDHRVPLVVGMSAVPMGVPHTRPRLLTCHATRPALVDRENPWAVSITLPSSFSSVLELKLGQQGVDAMGYVAHVPHLVLELTDPRSAKALVEAVGRRLELQFDVSLLDVFISKADPLHRTMIEDTSDSTNGEQQRLLHERLEHEYDQRDLAASVHDDIEDLPTGDELAERFQAFLADQPRGDDA